MNKSKELNTTQDIVKGILETFPPARNSDNILFVKVCERLNPGALNKPFWLVLGNLKEYNLPNIETVRRTRQKLQASFPELAADTEVQAHRIVNQGMFADYAKRYVKSGEK